MSSLLGAQLIMMVLMYIGTFISYYLPIRLFGKTVNNRADNELNNQLKLSGGLNFEEEEKQRRIYSNSNCFAIGIFLSMCFMNIPMVNEEFNSFLKEANLIGTVNYPLSELTILLGFFMVLYFEQLIIKFRTSNSAPFLHLDEETNDEQSTKLLGENSSSESVIIDQTNNRESQFNSEITELSNDVSTNFKGKNQFATGKLNLSNNCKSHNDHHYSFNHHSHDFHHHFNLNEFNNEINLGFFMLIFASSIHSVFEGLALGLIKKFNKSINLFIGIFLHECIIAAALGINAAKVNKGILFGLMFSATIPVGILLGIFLGYTPGVFGKLISATFQGLATGTFLQVAFNELMPTELHHNQHPDKLLRKIFLMFLGFLMMAFITLISD